MTIDSIDIETTIKNVEQMLREDKDISATRVSAIKVLLLVVKRLAGRLGLNSRNSSKPPASDPHREKTRRATRDKPVGGQAGHTGTTLLPIDEPDEIHDIAIDQRRLPRGHYRDVGVERRQVFDIRIERHVTEYRAQILESDDGMRFVAGFPHGVTRPAQYGAAVRANAVYMSMFQLIPYERVQTHFDELFGLPLSSGTLCTTIMMPMRDWRCSKHWQRSVWRNRSLFMPMKPASMSMVSGSGCTMRSTANGRCFILTRNADRMP